MARQAVTAHRYKKQSNPDGFYICLMQAGCFCSSTPTATNGGDSNTEFRIRPRLFFCACPEANLKVACYHASKPES
jgi:hypothetical protein